MLRLIPRRFPFSGLLALSLTLPIGMFAMSTAPHAALDYAGLTELSVTGAASHTIVRSDPEAAPGVTVSSGGTNALLCGAKAEIAREGDKLNVTVSRRPFSLGINCDLTVTVTLQDPLAVTIAQDQAVADLTGSFRRIAIDAGKSVVNFKGRTDSLQVTGDQSVINAQFPNGQATGAAQQAPHIDITVGTLVANLGYDAKTALDYAVEAPIVVFAHDFPKTPGADSRLRITSQILKGSVYALTSTE